MAASTSTHIRGKLSRGAAREIVLSILGFTGSRASRILRLLFLLAFTTCIFLAVFKRAADYSRQLDRLASTISSQVHSQLLDQIRDLKNTSRVVATRPPGATSLVLSEESEPLLKESIVIIKTLDPATSSSSSEVWKVDSQNSTNRSLGGEKEILEKLSLLFSGISNRGALLFSPGPAERIPEFKEDYLFATNTVISPVLQAVAVYPLRPEEALSLSPDVSREISAIAGNLEVRLRGDLLLFQDRSVHGANFLIQTRTRQIQVSSLDLQIRLIPLPLFEYLAHLCTYDVFLPSLVLLTGLLSLSITALYAKETLSMRQTSEAQKQLVATLGRQVNVLTEGHPLGIFIVDARGSLLHRNAWLTSHHTLLTIPMHQHWRHMLSLEEQKIADTHWKVIEQSRDSVTFSARMYSGTSYATCEIKLIPIHSADDVFAGAIGFISLLQSTDNSSLTALSSKVTIEPPPSDTIANESQQQVQNNLVLEGLMNLGEGLARLEQQSSMLKSEIAAHRPSYDTSSSSDSKEEKSKIDKTMETAPIGINNLHRELRLIRRQLAKSKTHSHSSLLEGIAELARISRPRVPSVRRYQDAVNERLENLEEMVKQLLKAKAVPTEIRVVDSLDDVLIAPKTNVRKRSKTSAPPKGE